MIIYKATTVPIRQFIPDQDR